VQHELVKKAQDEGGNTASMATLNNVLMQMRKNCNHPDLITSAFSMDMDYPSPEVLVQQCGKLALLNRLLIKLRAEGHKVLIFSQVGAGGLQEESRAAGCQQGCVLVSPLPDGVAHLAARLELLWSANRS
jgi:hypothetical protein